jgi:hypothetical protein
MGILRLYVLLVFGIIFLLSPNVLCEVYLEEPFDSSDDLSNWADNTGSYFDVDFDNAADIYEVTGKCNFNPNIPRQADICGWSGVMMFELDYRAKSGYSGSTVTNAKVDFFDNGKLGSIILVAGGTTDTGWEHRSEDVSSMLNGHEQVEIRLWVRDAWSTDWNQQAWFKNVWLYTGDPPGGGGGGGGGGEPPDPRVIDLGGGQYFPQEDYAIIQKSFSLDENPCEGELQFKIERDQDPSCRFLRVFVNGVQVGSTYTICSVAEEELQIGSELLFWRQCDNLSD